MPRTIANKKHLLTLLIVMIVLQLAAAPFALGQTTVACESISQGLVDSTKNGGKVILYVDVQPGAIGPTGRYFARNVGNTNWDDCTNQPQNSSCQQVSFPPIVSSTLQDGTQHYELTARYAAIPGDKYVFGKNSDVRFVLDYQMAGSTCFVRETFDVTRNSSATPASFFIPASGKFMTYTIEASDSYNKKLSWIVCGGGIIPNGSFQVYGCRNPIGVSLNFTPATDKNGIGGDGAHGYVVDCDATPKKVTIDPVAACRVIMQYQP